MVIMGPFSVGIVCLAAAASSLQVMDWLSKDAFPVGIVCLAALPIE
jgi:hypothetical protein